MSFSQYDVVIVGAGAAGLTAAIGLARSGFGVAVLEAAAFPGAENWSGCVYFAENLAHPEILGAEGVEELAWERRLVERGLFATDGHGMLGTTYRDPEAFRHCYTVLRPIYDHHLAQIALRHGVALLNNTTAESLIRDAGRIIGVCTQRGPLYADLVFLAEGDASHLVTREGYERYTDQREAPKFLQGIKQVIDLPPGAIEETFGVGPEEGVAYEILLRNGSMRGRDVRLNMGGFVYTNRQSLSVGLVLPADNLKEHFDGDPNLLLEWFENLPVLQRWLRKGKRGVFGAKIIRGGGAKDIPNLIDDGLAIGGAASAIGIDFPYPNFTGPATAMGLLLAQAVRHIRAEGGQFTRENLRRHYLEPLLRTHYWQDVEFLRRWPAYVKRTEVFFGRNLDLALGSAYVWTRPRRWFFTKWFNWLRLVIQVAGPEHWRGMRADARQLVRALRLREVVSRPALGRLLLDGTINAMRDLARSPRANLPPAGRIQLRYWVGNESDPVTLPVGARRWFDRLAPVLASAARRVYCNDDAPLSAKLPWASHLLLKQINMLDLVGTLAVGLAAAISGVFLAGWDRLRRFIRGGPSTKPPRGIYGRYASAARHSTDLSSTILAAGQQWDARLGHLAYKTVKASHIHLLWPRLLPNKNDVIQKGLWHVCPAHVYEARFSALGQLQVVVNFENCIKCEACWRTSDLVDWGRDGEHGFIYPVGSPVVTRLLTTALSAGSSRPAAPRTANGWDPTLQALAARLHQEQPSSLNGQDNHETNELKTLAGRLERKLREFDAALAKEPRHVDRARAEYLEMLARYAQQLALRMQDLLRESTLAESPQASERVIHQQLFTLTTALVVKAEERARRTWDQRFAWAAADGRQLRFHHLAGVLRLLDLLDKRAQSPGMADDPTRLWLRAEDDPNTTTTSLANWSARLDEAFPATAWREIDRGQQLTSAQDALLRDLIDQVPLLDPAELTTSLHSPLRKALLAELGRRDPSLAYRVASHLWARDLARLPTGSPALSQASGRWARGDEWACFAAIEGVQTRATGWMGEAFFVPALSAGSLLLLLNNQLIVVPAGSPRLIIEPLSTLGLRGAGLARIRLENFTLPDTRVPADQDRMRRAWQVLSSADLTSIAFGMADVLCQRAIAHATSRVQFPGLFHDEEARDPIAKFGAVKKMIAEMAARRYLIETLDHMLSPADFSSAWVERAGLVKALIAEAIGTASGSVSYNAGQVFGGTGYSEDDILAKYYRDASAWRYLGSTNAEVYAQHGEQLLRSWHPDGRRLATVEHEAELFDQVVQRKALQAELDEIRVLRSRLRALVNEWQNARKERLPTSASSEDDAPIRDSFAVAELTELLGRQDAHLMAGKALLLRTHARLEHGEDSEIEAALFRVWLQGAAVALQEFEGIVRQRLEPSGPREDRPAVDPGAGPPVLTYEAYLAAPCPYDSGDFLVKPVDLAQPRYVPELIEADPLLAAHDREFRELLTNHFSRPRGDGLPYERYIERQHRPDPADLDFCRQHGFFRMPIVKSLGGEERKKADYYLLTANAQRLVDVAISLTIQASTSIGTTPILLAHDKDLPKARKELAPFMEDATGQREIRSRLEKILELLGRDNPERMERASKDLHQRLEEMVLGRTVLRVLAHRFVQAWQQAGQAGKSFDLAQIRSLVEEALREWVDVCCRAKEYHEELGRRIEACALTLRWIASGQISAFALTEPSAGSDTARVATRAKLCSVNVEKEPDGILHFIPANGKDPRYLLDASRLEFRADGVYYHWSETAEPAPIRFDEYDYETDDEGRCRYYDHGSRRVHFTDIAQVRQRDGQLYYDYWELTGAKMWITNGRMAGVMSLYAKTEEGVTGFAVDRHAEGLIVGKDEAKLGQLGSPTNELSLQAVRVPRENVLGLEGRGQVNALETLNVGRAGLAISAMSQMAGIIDQARAFAQATNAEIPAWVAWRLQRMEEDRFSAEALALEVVGKFDHPQTRSVRMESAISKMLASEMLHRIIEWAEDIYGLLGQTQLHLIEKRKRDARILNLYEGTNEIQRFLILKELAAEVAPRWSRDKRPKLPGYTGPEALAHEALKEEMHQRLTAALEVFGQELWQNPNLQANCFLLSEAAAWLKAADSALGRLAWLDRQAQTEENPEPSPRLELARRAIARCHAEARNRSERFQEELAHLRRGFYAPEVRAASLLFDQQHGLPTKLRWTTEITRPLLVLVVLEPAPAPVPHPLVVDGQLLESHFTLNDADRSAIETALRLRDRALAAVTIQVVAVGPKGYAQVLRETLSLGVERARLLVAPADALAPESAASALAAMLGDGSAYDLLLGGAGGANSEEGLVGRILAEMLEIAFAGTAPNIVVRKIPGEADVLLADSEGRQKRVRPLSSAIGIEAGLTLRSFTMEGYLTGLAKAVELERWPKKVSARAIAFQERAQDLGPALEEMPHALAPVDAAQHTLLQLGLGGSGNGPVLSYEGAWEDVTYPTLLDTAILAILKADADGRLATTAKTALRAVRLLASAEASDASVLLLAHKSEDHQRRALAQVKELFNGDIVLLALDHAVVSTEVSSRLLKECWSHLAIKPRAVVGEPWTEDAFVALSRTREQACHAVLRVRRVAMEDNRIVVETARQHGKLRVRQTLADDFDVSYWMTLTADADASEPQPSPDAPLGRIQRWSPNLERFHGTGEMRCLLEELKQETGLTRLADADFIVDVGFGVGNRDGYETVVEPLMEALQALGVSRLVVGGSRKVTEELHLLPADRQIGQSGVSVNPQILLAIGISGAPQHLNYIGTRATILAFNRDVEAPIMTLNQRQSRPRVFPVVGDLFETVPAFTVALRREQGNAASPQTKTSPPGLVRREHVTSESSV